MLGLLFAYATNGHEIIELADRNILVDDPKDKDFAHFGDARCKIGDDPFSLGREMYFATYQALAEDERRDGLFKAFPPDFFDLVIVDECHRGSARDDSSWRAILDYFKPAYQLGMTATPLRRCATTIAIPIFISAIRSTNTACGKALRTVFLRRIACIV